ncbi:MAG: tetratricopeptide (TPR) repeat protein [Myxococcota bacterium]|jgi:tetratricopeptide (TPR) repeat protein
MLAIGAAGHNVKQQGRMAATSWARNQGPLYRAGRSRRINPVLLAGIIILVSTFVWAPLPAYAARTPDPTAVASTLGDKAREAYARGAFEEAIALYLDAYETSPSAGFLYNIAFIYKKKLGAPELAAQYYERVAKAPDADTELRAKATAKAAELQAELATRLPKDPVRPKDPTLREPDPKVPDGRRPHVEVKPPRVLDPPKPSVPTEPESSGTAIPWILMGTGAALLGTGIGFGIIATGTEDDFQAATDPARKRDLQSRGQGEAILGDVLMIAGIAGLGTGIVILLAEGDSKKKTSSGVHVAPMIVEGGGMVTIGGHL